MSQTLFLLYRPEPARPMSKTRSVGAHSICARGGLSYRKRARADMESAPTFFVAGGEGHIFPCCVCRGDHWSPAHLPPQRIFRDSCLVRQAGTGEQCSPLQEFSPVWARNIPARRTVLSPTACGRPPRGGGQGARFCLLCVQADFFRLRLVKNHLMWYTISLQAHRQTRCKPATQSYRGPSGQPVANKKLLFYCRR